MKCYKHHNRKFSRHSGNIKNCPSPPGWVQGAGGKVKRDSMKELQRCAVGGPSFQARETMCGGLEV